MCRSDDFTSTTTHIVLFPSYSFQCFYCQLASAFSHPVRVIRGCGTCRNSKLWRRSLALLGPWRFFLRFGITVLKSNLISGWDCGQQRFAPCCSQGCWDRWALQCFRQIHGDPKISASRSEPCSSRDHTRPVCLSRLP